ncbi:activity-regulated cytoskeleton-associated protein-like [Drosophila rhopaloa]|uniref:Retrotransposon gag domain-containing protein n=1 Tax=Drosophila rhopaloa TaxID=1041015 RepID=A0ABM5J2L9_DRORH|nr:activity-regulated cytoskeleton-associated protein-like [Drosophila rhopaloa]
MGVRWIPYRRKEELQLLLAEFGLPQGGTVEELRSRLATFLTREDLEPELLDRVRELASMFPEAATPRDKSPTPLGGQEPREQKLSTAVIDTGSTPLRLEVPPGNRPTRNTNADPPAREEISSATLAEKLRSWGILFDGQSDPLTFIERLEVQAEAYRLRTARLPRVISGLLTGKAESWYRTFQMQDVSWEVFRKEFLEFFLPPQYFQRLEDTIRTRYQQPGESCKEFVVELRLLMQRAKFTPAQELERLYQNLRPEYQLFVRRQDFEDLATLIQRATAYETAIEHCIQTF